MASMKTSDMSADQSCPNCGSKGMRVFDEVKSVPVNSCLLLKDPKEALEYPRGEIALGFCPSCGFVSNISFEPQRLRYSTAYEDQQSYSACFRAFQHELAIDLIKRYDLHGKTVIEIGCGKGDFLVEVCELGNNRGVGIDPAHIPNRLESPALDRISFIQDFYSEKYAHLTGDLVCCRHTLEHIPRTYDFLRTVQRTVEGKPDTVVFFEVPDVERVLVEIAFWDIYYEHCSYFSLGSLARLFRSCGFDILDLRKDFDDQYLLIEARPTNGTTPPRLPQEDDLARMTEQVDHFATQYKRKLQQWKKELQRIKEQRLRAAIWGSGSKCVAFLSVLEVRDEIDVIVDINPHRHGKYLAGSGKQIKSPEYLRQFKPEFVIVMNPIYREEIKRDLEGMGLKPEIVAV